MNHRTFFNATEKQLLEAAALAANAAQPVGMGYFQYDADKTYTAKDMRPYLKKNRKGFRTINIEVDCDYVGGRCTKFRVWPVQPIDEGPKGYKFFTGYETDPHYETWYTKYETHVDLLEAAGITDVKVV